ncbi:MAG: HlyD family efflux transporter periplasmic adaptor subunit [Tenuifilaceae bacterium]|jgi:HlyD family secretion protein|nr:HlyD family efflux transporter periplasmic adaptor subunit [Tenuifilaceae bacterium]
MKTKNLILVALATLLCACNNGSGDYDATGTFETTEVIVSAEGSGKILKFDVDEGQLLDLSQVVGYIDSTQLFLRRKQLLASRQALLNRRPDIGKQLATLNQQLATAKHERIRLEKLVAENAATTKQLDDMNAQIQNLEKKLDATKSSLEKTDRGLLAENEALELQIAQIDDQIAKCRVVSPIKGIVLVKYAQAGELAVVGKPLFKVGNIDNMILRAYITGDQISQLKIGQTVKVFADFDEKGSREYEGVVGWLSSKSEFTPKTIQTRNERANLVYAIKINVKNDGYLKIGMHGGVRVR